MPTTVRFIFFTILIAAANFGALLAKAETPLRLSPAALKAQLSPRVLVYRELPDGWEVGGVKFSTQENQRQTADESGQLLRLGWDPNLIKPQRIMIREPGGQIHFEQPYKSGEYTLTSDSLNPVKMNLTSKSDALSLRKSENFQAPSPLTELCLIDHRRRGSALLCTALSRNASSDPKSFGLIVQGKTYQKTGSISFAQEDDIEFILKLRSGVSFQLLIEPQESQLFELQLGTDSFLEAIVQGQMPMNQSQALTPQRSWLFQHTIGDQRKFFKIRVPMLAPFVHYDNDFGLKVQRKIESANLAQLDVIPKVEQDPLSTYSSRLLLTGTLPDAFDIKPNQDSIELNERVFRWQVDVPLKRSYNLAQITFLPRGQKAPELIFDTEIYRSYGTYLSARLGAMANLQVGFLGAIELHAIHWFEQPLGPNPRYSRLRWGLSASYVSDVGTTDIKNKYQVKSAAAYYRFSAGVEDWDESIGIWTGYLGLDYQDAQTVSLWGGGFFLTRSLPPWSNYFVGVFEFFRRPKWFNLSIGAHPYSLNPKIKAWVAEAKAVGRIDLTEHTYFEGGWAILASQFSYDIPNGNLAGKLAVGRAYFGYGYRF